MVLEHLFVDGVRNLAAVRLAPHPRLNAFIGPNGQGKTNLLEAIHLVAALRPLRALERAADLITFGRERGVIRASFQLDGPLSVEVICEPRGRRATLAGKAVRDIGEVAARIGVVSFAPDDVAMLRGGPDGRRRALDRFAYGIEPGFGAIARRFDEALERRNQVLKAPIVDVALLESYDAPYVLAAAALTLARARAAQRWAPVFAAEARAIGGDALEAELAYVAAIPGDDEAAVRDTLAERLAAARSVELKKRSTASGPHHDDVLLLKGERKARFLASQGEARALVLALKLAAVRLTTEARGTGPLLLLDDVAGELDAVRAARLFRAADDTGAQVFVTATSVDVLPALSTGAVFTLTEGRLAPS